ncbi:GGDEF domain-containing protein [Pseudomonas matsuisoli]|uniref:diguanylate cyclase n=1 Tax=Pseudomonas matsuisoli TaxID=1515666 RepID=A0A917PWS6_9PSED|nr:diguanylate cyclase [Pseudomonas matsuisoli]GGJ96005.1 GGDEF domain-containing protein [Pseudomonas matsuisoli]
MSDEQRWKTKYLESLEQQEVFEQRWETRLDLLRRGLVRSSLAAEGSDKAVDQCMKELRNVVRSDNMDAALSALIPRLEKAVLDSEQRRQQRAEMIAQSLGSLASRLQQMQLPREVNKPLKAFAKQVNGSAIQSSELPALLAELNRLQAQALDVIGGEPSSRSGFLQRLFGGGEGAVPATPATTIHAEHPDAVSQPGEPLGPDRADSRPEVASEPELRATPALQPDRDTAPVIDPDAPELAATNAAPIASEPYIETLSEPAPTTEGAEPSLEALPEGRYALPQPPEPGYSAVAPHIAASLNRLLDELSLPQSFTPQAESLKTRLQGGLNWYELVPLLDDLGVLVLAVSGDSDHAFARYLAELSQRLAAFVGGLNQAKSDYNESISDARVLDDELRGHVTGLQADVQDAVDLESLKRTVDSRLDGLLATMSDFQQRNNQREQEVSERLEALVARVAVMEQEAHGAQQHLEEQRMKALTDALTGLPNRASWAERAQLEEARWQRYGGDLLLVVLDIDHFKRINDEYGHLAGDKVLKIIGQELQKRLRKTDFIARFGGEEFALLLPETSLAAGQQLLDDLRGKIAACPFHFKGQPVSITFSAGVVAFEGEDSAEAAFDRADQALYRAKRAGRNRVERG